MKRPKLVWIEWVDSRQGEPQWQHLDNFKPFKPCKNITVGFLIFEDKKQVCVSQCIGDVADGPDDFQVAGIPTITKCSITKIKRLKCP